MLLINCAPSWLYLQGQNLVIKFLLIRFVFYIPHVLQRTYLARYQFYCHNIHRSIPAS